MTTEQTTAATRRADTAPNRSSAGTIWAWLFAVLGISAVVAIAWNARDYPDARIGNPNVTGAPRPVEPLFGYTHWLGTLQVFTIIAVIGLIAAFVWGWRRYGPHPYLLMGLVTTIIVWQDPIMNWAPYAVYNPRLWHWPESWPLVSLSPTIEPFVVIGYVMFQFGPYFPAAWVLRKIQARRPVDAFVWRHPLSSLGVLILVFGFIIDMILEVTLVRTGMYIYAQVIPSVQSSSAHRTSFRCCGNPIGHGGDDSGGDSGLSRRHRPHGF